MARKLKRAQILNVKKISETNITMRNFRDIESIKKGRFNTMLKNTIRDAFISQGDKFAKQSLTKLIKKVDRLKGSNILKAKEIFKHKIFTDIKNFDIDEKSIYSKSSYVSKQGKLLKTKATYTKRKKKQAKALQSAIEWNIESAIIRVFINFDRIFQKPFFQLFDAKGDGIFSHYLIEVIEAFSKIDLGLYNLSNEIFIIQPWLVDNKGKLEIYQGQLSPRAIKVIAMLKQKNIDDVLVLKDMFSNLRFKKILKN